VVGLDWFSALILGIVQGLTELLPVSSSGHLVLAEKALGLDLSDLSFEISVHVATALGLCLILRNELGIMARSLLPFGLSPETKKRGRSLLLNVLVGSIPAVIVGVLASDQIKAVFHGPTLTFAMLPVTGAFLLLTKWSREKALELGPGLAFLVGAAQAIAILPGISRSGLTIGAALLLGVRKEEAVKFSFLLSLPAIAGGAVLEFSQGLPAESTLGLDVLAIGSVTAFACAIFAAKVLLRIVRRGKLEYFGYYCLLLGTLGLFLTVL
jgi:undecaprenyl-diphosphatase